MPKIIYAIDDEPAITRILKINLERIGYQVETCNDSHEALETLQSGTIKPDLIFSDVTMPYMDGFEFLNRVKADPNLEHIPFVMITARSRDADILEGRSRGVAGYITKPVVLEELFSTVKIILEEHEKTAEETEQTETA